MDVLSLLLDLFVSFAGFVLGYFFALFINDLLFKATIPKDRNTIPAPTSTKEHKQTTTPSLLDPVSMTPDIEWEIEQLRLKRNANVGGDE